MLQQASAASRLGADVRIPVFEDEFAHGAESGQEFISFTRTISDPTLKFEIVRKGKPVPGRPAIVGVFPATQAFTQTYTTDAHFAQYAVYTDGTPITEGWGRVNKNGAIDLAKKGVETQQTVIGIDLDTNGHVPWSDTIRPQGYLPGLVAVFSKDPVLARWWAFYLTRSGARLVYRLQTPVKFTLVEAYIRGLTYRLEEAGVRLDLGTFQVDHAAEDWTRLLRLPRVVREGVATYDTEVVVREENRLDLLEEIQPRGKPTTFAVAAPRYDGARPAEDDVEINFEKGGLWYEWRKIVFRRYPEVKFVLVAKGERGLVDGDGQEPGGRNTAIHSVAGQAVAYLFSMSLSTSNEFEKLTGPETIYGLLLPSVQQFAPDEKSRVSWPETLWDSVVRLWGREAAHYHDKAVTAEVAKVEREVKTLTVTDSILAGVARWSTNPVVLDPGRTQSEKMNEVKRHLIVSPGGHQYFVLRQDGYYTPDSVGKDLLIATMRREGLGSVIDLEKVNDDGEIEELDEVTVLRRHSLAATDLAGAPESLDLPGGKLVICGTQVMLRVPLFGLRRDIEPAFHPQVEGWLQAFGHEEIFEYIARALDFRRPMPLAALDGPPSIGKQLLVRGFRECLTTQAIATDRDFGRFGPIFMKSPFVLVNEDVEESFGGKEISAYIRQITSGDGVWAERKFKAPTFVNTAMRVIVTANNQDLVLRLLGQNKDLTPNDREALKLRLLHLPITDAPARYLEKLGGMDFTSKQGARWVEGVDGAPSDHIVAKHFLWTHRNRKYPEHSGRFAMAGKVGREMLHELSTRGGSSSLVVKTLLAMVEVAKSMNAVYGFVAAPAFAKDRIFVTARAVAQYYERNVQDQAKKPLDERKAGMALKGLRAPNSDNDPRILKAPGANDKKNRWTEVLLETLLIEASEHGFKSENLVRLSREAGIEVEGESGAGAS